MKRKRGPAPHGKKSRIKLKQTIATDPVEDSDQEGNEFDDEQDSFRGISDNDDDDEDPEGRASEPVESEKPVNGTTKKGKRRGGTKPAPTKEQLMDLLFQSSSFQSNLFKLQVDQLLSEIRVKHDKMEKVEHILHKLKDILTTLPESQETLVTPQSSLFRARLTKKVTFV